MKKLLSLFTSLLVTFAAHADPIKIHIVSSLGVNTIKSTMLLNRVALVNTMQSTYQLTVEFKPGADGRIALRSADLNPKNTIVGTGSYYVKHIMENKINESDYNYVEFTGHDMCTAINTNVGDAEVGISSLKALAGQTIVVGTNAHGAPDHLAALQLSLIYGFDVKVVIFKTPVDAYVNMVGNHGVNMVFTGPPQYLKFKDKNEKLKILGINCDTRSVLVPHIRTAKEQGFNFPRAFGFMLARKEMPDQWRSDIGRLLTQADEQLPKNQVSLYSTDPNWFAIRVAEQKDFLKQFRTTTTALNQ